MSDLTAFLGAVMGIKSDVATGHAAIADTEAGLAAFKTALAPKETIDARAEDIFTAYDDILAAVKEIVENAGIDEGLQLLGLSAPLAVVKAGLATVDEFKAEVSKAVAIPTPSTILAPVAPLGTVVSISPIATAPVVDTTPEAPDFTPAIDAGGPPES